MIVHSSTGAYEIVRLELPEIQGHLPPESFLITDSNLAACYPELVSAYCSLILPPGEATKSIAAFGECLGWLAHNRASRGSTLVALGGGVIGDLVGFVASAYMRGVPYVQVPTTLLALVDSSVGGKVAIDLPEGKNLAGAFYPPRKVVLCHGFLKTLPEREFSNGMAEVLKYGFIANPNILEWALSTDAESIHRIIGECIRIKAEIVQRDEFEKEGLRATLNFGHTVGHAIERILNYGELLHGEAVAIGMVVEARLGTLIGLTHTGVETQVEAALARAGLPTSHPVLHREDDLVESMYHDKKSEGGKLTFSLLTRMGSCRLAAGVDERQVRQALR